MITIPTGKEYKISCQKLWGLSPKINNEGKFPMTTAPTIQNAIGTGLFTI